VTRAREQFAVEIPTLDAAGQIALLLALGRAYMNLQQVERPFNRRPEGNALKRRQLTSDEKEILGVFERIRTVLTRDPTKRKFGGGDRSLAPVSIAGLPRWGGTLVEQVLASHCKIYGTGAIEAFGRTVASFRRPEISAGEFAEMINSKTASKIHDREHASA